MASTTLTFQESNENMREFAHMGEAYLQPLIYAVGMVTNVLSFVVIRKMSVSKVIKTLLCSVCITDFLSSFCGFSYIILEIVLFGGDMVYGYWSTSAVAVFTMYKLYLMFLGMSCALVIMTSVVRTYSIAKPFHVSVKFTRAYVIKLILVTIAVTFVGYLPLSIYIVWKSCYMDQTTPLCVDFFTKLPRADIIRYYFVLVAMVLGPGVVIGNLVCLCLLRHYLKKSLKVYRTMSGDGQKLNNARLKKSLSINYMFYTLLTVNTICMLPSCVQVVFVLINPDELVFNKTSPAVAVYDVIAEVFLAVLSSYNFWMYLAVNKDFRLKFRKVFDCWKKSEKESGKLVNSSESWLKLAYNARHSLVNEAYIRTEEEVEEEISVDSTDCDRVTFSTRRLTFKTYI